MCREAYASIHRLCMSASPSFSRRDAHRLIASFCTLPAAMPLLAQTTASTVEAKAQHLPTEAFAQLPLLDRLHLSPDGQHLAGVINLGDTSALVVQGVAPGSPVVPLLKTDNQRFMFNWIRWITPDLLVASLRYASTRGAVDTQERRLMSVRRDGSKLLHLDLKPNRDGGQMTAAAWQIQDHVVDWLPDDAPHVLLALTGGGNGEPAIYKLDVTNGQRDMVHPAKRGVVSWLLDRQHQVRIGVAQNGEQFEIIERAKTGADWRSLWKFERYSEKAIWPLGFDIEAQTLWVQAWHQDHWAVFTVDLTDPALALKLQLALPGIDIDGGLRYSPRTGEVVGINHTSTASETSTRVTLWEPELQALAQMIDKQLPGRYNHLVSFSRDEDRYLLYSSGNGIPGQYFVGQRSQGQLVLLSDTLPKLPRREMVGKQSVRILARDGLTLRAYISHPKGAKSDQPLPLVLLPHGGPESSDDDDFDTWTEFLANRGYRVLQVNFRGSDGAGLAHKQAGIRRWGLEMQDDLTDAVQWAVAQKLADPQRLAIAGASYGGYAALMGAVKTPELFRCAISFAGVSNLADLVFDARNYTGGLAGAEAQIGNTWGDSERLRATSPALQAARIQVPVLLVHGTSDRIVPFDQSKTMASALSRAGKPYQFIELEGGDHHLSRYRHRLEFFQAMEAFLAKHTAALPA
jgi:dipeptidyl aminopeptidase/acylaminoacyl peptidase